MIAWQGVTSYLSLRQNELSTSRTRSPQRPLVQVLAPSFTLKCHGKDTGCCQSKGGRGEDHHSHKPCCMPCTRRPQGAPRRLRPPGERFIRPWNCARRQPTLHL